MHVSGSHSCILNVSNIVLARLGDDRVQYPAHNCLYRSAEKRVYKQLGIGTDTGIISPRLVSVVSILSRQNFKVAIYCHRQFYLLIQLHGGLI